MKVAGRRCSVPARLCHLLRQHVSVRQEPAAAGTTIVQARAYIPGQVDTMQALAERAKQALGLGRDLFVSSSLEAQQATLKELDVFVPPLKSMLKAAKQFKDETKEFLDASATHLTASPFPRLWVQASVTEPATALHVPAPAEQAAWYDAETHDTLATTVTASVEYAMERELVGPMEQWLLAYDVAKGTLGSLEARRLDYDATRRRLVTAAARAATDEAQEVETGASGQQEALVVTGGPQLVQLQELAAATSAELIEYETEVEALDDTLTWLVSGAARLKALIADAAGGAAEAAKAWQVPAGIMPPLQEKSVIGQDIDVTLEMTDAPRGGLDSSSSFKATTTISPDLAVSVQPKEGPSTEGKGTPDLSSMLPSDQMVYGGGIAPEPASHPPTGGGPAVLVKDTLAGPTTTPAAPEVVPRPSRSYSGEGVGSREKIPPHTVPRLGPGQPGLAASPEVEVAEPGRKQLSTVVLSATPEAPAAASGSSSSAGTTAAEGEGAGSTTYSSNVSTQALPASTSTPAAAGTSAGSSSTAGDAAAAGVKGGGLMAAISRMFEEAAGRTTSAAPSQGFGGSNLPQSAATAAADAAVAAKHTAAGSSAAAELRQQPQGNKFEVQGVEESAKGYEETSSFKQGGTSGADCVGDMHIGPISPSPGSEPAPGSAVWVKDATPPGGAAAAGVHSSSTAEETQQGAMHIGPVPPSPGSEPAPGSAVWVKDATPPGGAAAEGTAASAPAGGQPAAGQPGDQAGMHIGPVAPSPGSEPAPGSAVWVKDATPPGGAAADGTVAPPAPTARPAAPAEAPAGASDSSGKSSPDLSKVLPSYDKLPGTTKAKPSGGGIGALIRDTLLGPPATEGKK